MRSWLKRIWNWMKDEVLIELILKSIELCDKYEELSCL